jgi:hypothetical protein
MPLLVVWLHPDGPLMDPGTPWHLRTGQWILHHHSLPFFDPFSWTQSNSFWLNYEWLFEVFIAALAAAGNLPLVTATSLVLYALLPALLLHRMLQEGSDVLSGVLVCLAVYLITWPHALVRPHIFTYLFFLVFLRTLHRYEEGKIPARSLSILPLLLWFWSNLHGGFLVGLIVLGAYGLAALLRWRKGHPATRVWTYSLLFGVSSLFVLLNPNGSLLILGILQHLFMPALAYWQEFQPPDFLDGGSSVRLYGAWLILCFVLLATRRMKFSLAEWILFVFLVWQSLHAVRHMILVALLSAPALAQALTPWSTRWFVRFQALSREQANLSTHFLQVAALACVFISSSLVTPQLFRQDFLDLRLTRGAEAYLRSHADRFERMFNSDDLGGALIYQTGLRVFMDDRSDLYKQQFIEKEYLPLLLLQPGWQEIMERWKITSAVVSQPSRLGQALDQMPQWEKVYADEKVALYLKR